MNGMTWTICVRAGDTVIINGQEYILDDVIPGIPRKGGDGWPTLTFVCNAVPPLCSVSLSPLVMRFAADCIESWAKMMSRLTPSHKAHPSHDFALFLADHVIAKMRKAYRTTNAENQGRKSAPERTV